MTEATDVVVIGAGPAGLAAAACLKRAGVSFIVIEKKPEVGASWRRHYARLRLHTIKQLSALPGLAFPKSDPRYVPRARVIAYLQRYAEHFGLAPRLGEAVRSVRRDGARWQVRTDSSDIRAAHVVIATGLNAAPVTPAVPGIARFGGRITHSADYSDAAPFAGQSVLVIGMGNTGAEIALDLADGGARPTVSVRNGVHMVPRDLFGIPIQLVARYATGTLPERWSDALFPPILDFALGNLARHGIVRPPEGILRRARAGRIPVLDVGTARRIREGAIRIARGIKTVTVDGATFEDGTSARFDAIIFATGFRPNYPALFEEGIDPNGEPSIHLVGFATPITGALRQIAAEAEALAAKIAGDLKATAG